MYLGTMDCLKKIVKHEGVLALYNGLEATMMRQITWNAGYFGVIFQVKAQLPAKPELLNNFIAGTMGGCVGTVLNTPFDVVKSRIQNSPRTTSSLKYNWSIPSLFIVAREEGFWALYKGFVPKVLRLGPGGGILLVVYNALMEFFRKYKLS
jgi:solute carrier family 25 2-oxodicarboxylate transporter 21